MKVITGYVREKGGTDPLANITVTVRDDVMGTTIAAGGMAAASANPMTSDANGMFTWSCELSPGPLRVEADITPGVEVQVRRGFEMMQIGEDYISDIGKVMNGFTDGIIEVSQGTFLVEPVVGQRQVRVRPGMANMHGHVFETHTDRTLTIAANATLATRKDAVVLEQYIGGTYKGKQNIAVVAGTVNNTLPAINADPNIFQFMIGQVNIAQNATSVTVTLTPVFAEPKIITLDAGQVTMENLAPEVVTYINNSFPGITIQKMGVTQSSIAKTLDFGSQFNIGGAGAYQTINLGTNIIGTDQIVDGSLVNGDLADNTIMPVKMNTAWRPRILRDESDTDNVYSAAQNSLASVTHTLEAGSYAWMAWAWIRGTDTSSSAQPRAWLRILVDGAENAAEFYYYPGGFSGNGGSVQVMANGTITGGSHVFTLNTSIEQGVVTVLQRQIMVWVQRIA